MRGAAVVLALVVTPFIANVSHAQARPKGVQRREAPAQSRRCDDRPQRGIPSQNGSTNRADPRLQGNKNCPAPSPTPTPEPAPMGHTEINGMLFNDANGNGVKDDGELPLAGWTVQLSGSASQSQASGPDGSYTFSQLAPGLYTVCAAPPAGWAATTPGSGPDCGGGLFGYSLEAPAFDIDVWYTFVDFGFRQ